MVGLVTTREPIRGAMAKQMRDHMMKMAAARAAGTIRRAQSPHKTNVQLIEVANA